MEKPTLTAMLPSLNMIGAGRAGTTLAIAFAAAGLPVQLFCRDSSRRAQLHELFAKLRLDIRLPVDLRRDANCVLILAVPDRQLRQLAAELAVAPVEALWLHLSGALPAQTLRSDAHPQSPLHVGSLHPLAALTDPLLAADADLAQLLAPVGGALFALDGDADAIVIATQLARRLGALPLVVGAEQRALYHTAAALVANDLVALIAIGLELTAQAQLPQPILRAGLLHLAQTSLDALKRVPSSQPLISGLTGAVARGDAQTLQRHLATLTDVGHRQAHLQLSVALIRELQRAGQLSEHLIAALREVVTHHDRGAADGDG